MANWILTKEKNRFTIRKSKGERYPREKYAGITSERELEDLVIRLNGKDPAEERTQRGVLFKHAFISPDLLDKYLVYLKSRIPKTKDAKTVFGYLQRYALNFFIGKMNLPNPRDWHKEQDVWSLYLRNTDPDLEPSRVLFKKIMSAKVLKATVYELNRFMAWLHQQRPEEVIPLVFNPLSEAMYSTHEAIRKNKGLIRQSRYIKPEHWKSILKESKKYQYMNSPMCLSYHYGCRRNETLGFIPQDVKNGNLSIERQYGGEVLKDKELRKVPHWFCKPNDALKWIQQIPKVHPDTVSATFSKICEDLSLPPYTFHDIRRTFITNAVKAKKDPEDLRLAMGHSTIETTYRYYVMDSRELEDEIFSPDDAA